MFPALIKNSAIIYGYFLIHFCSFFILIIQISSFLEFYWLHYEL